MAEVPDGLRSGVKPRQLVRVQVAVEHDGAPVCMERGNIEGIDAAELRGIQWDTLKSVPSEDLRSKSNPEYVRSGSRLFPDSWSRILNQEHLRRCGKNIATIEDITSESSNMES